MDQDKEPKRRFEGIWIPKEIWLDRSLSVYARMLLAEISSLHDEEMGGCFASNKYLADLLGLSAGGIANLLVDLRKRGFLETVSFDGRRRAMRVTLHGGNRIKGSCPDDAVVHAAMKSTITEGLTPSYKENKEERKEEINTSELSKVSPSGCASQLAGEMLIYPKRIPPKPRQAISECASQLAVSLLQSIRLSNPMLKEPNIDLWCLEIDRMFRLDKREEEEASAIISWLPNNIFWRHTCLSAASLRRNFDQLVGAKALQEETQEIQDFGKLHKLFAGKIKEFRPQLAITKNGVFEPGTGFELSYNMPYEDFCRSLAKHFEITQYEGDM